MRSVRRGRRSTPGPVQKKLSFFLEDVTLNGAFAPRRVGFPNGSGIADMKIGRDCSSPLHSGSLTLSSIPLRSQTLPCFTGVVLLRCSTPLACRVAPCASGCSGPLLTYRFCGMFVAVDRTHAVRSVTHSPRPRADALARCERGPLRPCQSPLNFYVFIQNLYRDSC